MKTDMSAKSVSTRLKRVSQLRRLCLSLGNSKPISKQRLNNNRISEESAEYSTESKKT